MILTSHIIAGSILAGQTSSYFLAAAISLASHYLLDTVPHWEYPIGEFKRIAETRDPQLAKKEFWLDLAKAGADMLVGSGLAFLFGYYILEINWKFLAIGGFFSILPDALHFLSWFLPFRALQAHNRFHHDIHTKLKPGPLAGAITQIIAIVIILAIAAVK